ncbi:Ubiquitin carboxyl-terminal hydrolase [Actinidia chinensis var. chinensis]|uniref:Ubiquitin carboxyl-terminal hydrolase n=1 Tax=Actinidia chinensis var. chinensis TaxID=1590841 RepID=A0A2R6R211_ACTCC|nr:Ubiquitin carboxyl-terminal hydrolase [Actinidia chinensis var. chinensis]
MFGRVYRSSPILVSHSRRLQEAAPQNQEPKTIVLFSLHLRRRLSRLAPKFLCAYAQRSRAWGAYSKGITSFRLICCCSTLLMASNSPKDVPSSCSPGRICSSFSVSSS